VAVEAAAGSAEAAAAVVEEEAGLHFAGAGAVRVRVAGMAEAEWRDARLPCRDRAAVVDRRFKCLAAAGNRSASFRRRAADQAVAPAVGSLHAPVAEVFPAAATLRADQGRGRALAVGLAVNSQEVVVPLSAISITS
jgi:hypothetical protein